MARRSGLGKGLSALIPTEVDGRSHVRAARGSHRQHQAEPPPAAGELRRGDDGLAGRVHQGARRAAARPGPPRSAGSPRTSSSSSPVSDGGGRHAVPASTPFPSSSRRPTTPTASSRRWSRTSIVRTSTSWRRLPPISSSSRSSDSPTTRWPPGWGRAGPRSPTSSACCSCRPGCSGCWPRGRSAPGHARALLGTPDRGFQEVLARRCVADGLTVRAIEELVRYTTTRPTASFGTSARPDGPADRLGDGPAGRAGTGSVCA